MPTSFGFTFSLLGVELIVPAAAGSSQALLAVALLMIPGFVLRKKSLHVEDLGTTIGPLGPLIKIRWLHSWWYFPLFALCFTSSKRPFLVPSLNGQPVQWTDGIKIEHAPPNPCCE